MLVEVEVVEETSTGMFTEENVVDGEWKLTTVEEGEGGSTGRMMMPVGFFVFLRTAFKSSESSESESESDSEDFRGISVGGGGTS